MGRRFHLKVDVMTTEESKKMPVRKSRTLLQRLSLLAVIGVVLALIAHYLR